MEQSEESEDLSEAEQKHYAKTGHLSSLQTKNNCLQRRTAKKQKSTLVLSVEGVT